MMYAMKILTITIVIVMTIQYMAMHVQSMSLKAPMVLKKFHIETHGCQSNLADSDVVRSILLTAGYTMCDVLEDADLILTNTCAIRENAESKIHQRIKYFESLKKKNKKYKTKVYGYPLVGILGCMAERLKDNLLAEEGVDFIAGPDSYRDLPNLLHAASLLASPSSTASDESSSSSSSTSITATTDIKNANVQLSLDETYADISPVRLVEGNTHAFVTITRGCNNHCAFCIVPYVRGRERSRPLQAILSDVSTLRETGYKEVVLLGQNVNSYWDTETPSLLPSDGLTEYRTAEGFLQKSKIKAIDIDGGGVRFGELLQRVSEIDPNMRIRFQSPHPKDFTDDLLHLIKSLPNVCNSLHMPAQHGSSSVLDRMKRGYTRDAYTSLIHRARSIIAVDTPSHIGLGLSTDLISGFCGETDAEHQDNISLVREIGYDQAFTYSYSRREQTYAGLFYQDDVLEDIKASRLTELIDTFQSTALARNRQLECGRLHAVLVEGVGKTTKVGGKMTWTGRTDTNKRVVFVDQPVMDGLDKGIATSIASLNMDGVLWDDDSQKMFTPLLSTGSSSSSSNSSIRYSKIEKGDYVVVKIIEARGHTLRAVPIAKVGYLLDYHRLHLPSMRTYNDVQRLAVQK